MRENIFKMSCLWQYQDRMRYAYRKIRLAAYIEITSRQEHFSLPYLIWIFESDILSQVCNKSKMETCKNTPSRKMVWVGRIGKLAAGFSSILLCWR